MHSEKGNDRQKIRSLIRKKTHRPGKKARAILILSCTNEQLRLIAGCNKRLIVGTRLHPSIEIVVLSPFSHLVPETVMAVNTQHTPEESSDRIIEECGWSTLLGESDPFNRSLQILFMLTLRLPHTNARKSDLQQLFPRSRARCWPVPEISSTDS